MKVYEARRLRRTIETAAQSLPDDEALTAVMLHPNWKPGVDYTVGYRVRCDGKLWRCRQAHSAIAGWEPPNAQSLWEQVCERHTGAEGDPIPYDGNMALVSGLYYTQDGRVYICIRDTGNPVYHALAALVGLYVEEVM